MGNVLSLFDGISCARVALDKAGIKYKKYFASEIDKYSLVIAKKNYPDTIFVGDIRNLKGNDFTDIDLLIGGSPCQDLSIAKRNREGLKGKRSGLFWEYVRLLKEIKPKYFILENVASMPKKDKKIITDNLRVDPIMIDAALVSAQQRKRLFWIGKYVNGKYTQINIPQPKDRKIYLKDILESGFPIKGKAYCLTASEGRRDFKNDFCKKNKGNYVFKNKPIRIGKIGNRGQGERVYNVRGKSVCLSANGGGRGAKTGLYEIDSNYVRKLTPIECERLQGLPDNYTAGISNTQRYKTLGNAFNVDVITHILLMMAMRGGQDRR